MVNAIYGKKVGSTQVFNNAGNAIFITAIEAEPCIIVQVKDAANDGYNALKVGFGSVKEKKVTNPIKGIFEKGKLPLKKYLKEIRFDNFDKDYKCGDQIDIQIFKVGDKVKITGNSKGKGFAGVIERHNFHRGPVSHGSHNIRQPGSVGMCFFTFKNCKRQKNAWKIGRQKGHDTTNRNYRYNTGPEFDSC